MTGQIRKIGSINLELEPKPNAILEATDIAEYFAGVTTLRLPPESVTALASAIQDREFDTLIIYAEAFRVDTRIEARIWKIQGVRDGHNRRRNVLIKAPEAKNIILMTLHLSDGNREKVFSKILNHATKGLEVKLLSNF
ncbi:hypothetical protein [Thermococcus nautili]|uniref:Uncharacterized protein n=2 Tax=Thermococcus nautili TaxID=195522 RepID=W8PL75_9EURY|nr:hypothetical protein [Thermococcus nautili]AHL22789.1 hypothetical protein BD01_1172 [Thermococcus nautili]CAI1492862.1 conserved protein of unknown function [Thermococcus nautili]